MNLLFNDLCPDNKDIEHVLLKVSALNDFYRTHIYDTFAVSKHILNCNIDKALSKGCSDLVNKIAPVTSKGKTKKNYSFASKYCSHHRPEFYPIYDSYVEKMLMHFKKTDKFTVFKKIELKTYKRFKEIIQKFQQFYNLNNYTLREVDIYLWLAAKEYFPIKY